MNHLPKQLIQIAPELNSCTQFYIVPFSGFAMISDLSFRGDKLSQKRYVNVLIFHFQWKIISSPELNILTTYIFFLFLNSLYEHVKQ